jgi:hypothetical protein
VKAIHAEVPIIRALRFCVGEWFPTSGKGTTTVEMADAFA